MEIVDIDDLENALWSLRKRLAQVSTQASPSIYVAPRQLRDVNKKSYEPEMVAIGPYHHGKDEIKKMEEMKVCYMQSLLHRKPDVPVERYLSAIARVEKKARGCYAEPISLDPAKFIEMLVLDGCFIIELIGNEASIHNDRTFRKLECDLVLLENQIPMFVLCELYDLIEGPDKHSLLMERILLFCNTVFPGNILYKPMKKSEEVKHILDLIHSNWYPSTYHNISAIEASPTSLNIPSAAQLTDANVKFKKREYDKEPYILQQTRGTTVFDVEFDEDDGVMLMPTLVIEDNTESLLRNLIAYEQFFPACEAAPVTDYALLLDCLINSSKDIQILSQNGIIENLLSSDQAVVDFVNRLTDKIIYSVNFIYADTFNRINIHQKNCWNRAVAVYHREYFSSPWAYVSFFAAFVLLMLTIAQTIFASLQQFN